MAGDMDADGDLDIVVENAVYLNDGAGNFPVARNFGQGSDPITSLAVGDMDGNGDLDIVVGEQYRQNEVYLNDGAGNFPAARNFGPGTDDTRSLAIGDMDGDGDLDVVVGNYGGQNMVYLNDGAGNFLVGAQLRPRDGLDHEHCGRRHGRRWRPGRSCRRTISAESWYI